MDNKEFLQQELQDLLALDLYYEQEDLDNYASENKEYYLCHSDYGL